MIKKFNDFEQTRAYSDSQQLPRGGYVCKIIGAKPEENQYGQRIRIAFDIVEGEYANYYQQKYDSSTSEDKKWSGTFNLNVPADDGTEKDGWTKRKFRTFTDALEDSNPGYHFDWDETKFKGKLIGFVFNCREWYTPEGKLILIPNAKLSTSIDKIRNGNFKIPKDEAARNRPASVQRPEADEFMSVPAGVDEELPF